MTTRGSSSKPSKDDRLRAALRANLGRRKAQARSRDADADGSGAGSAEQSRQPPHGVERPETSRESED